MNIPKPPTLDQSRGRRDETPLSPEDVEKFLQDAVPEVLRELYYIGMNVDKDVSTGQQIKAIEILLDRGLGKATQHIDVTHDTYEILERIQQGRAISYTPPSVLDVEVEEDG